MEETRPDGKLGTWMATALVIGNMVGSGVFLLPAALAAFGGVSLVGWLFTSAGALLIALTLGKLSRLIPSPGGPYAYARVGFGEFAGFLVAWGYWISVCAGNAAIAVALVGYLAAFWPVLSHDPVLAAVTALANIWLLTFVNCTGIQRAGQLQLLTTVLKLAPLLLIGTLGFLAFDLNNLTPFNPSGQSMSSAVNATATLTLWAFLGIESATIPRAEISDPKRTIPLSTILGTGVTAVIYVCSTTAVLGVIPREQLSQSTAPFSETAAVALGPWAATLVAAGAVAACFGALNGWILLQGQFPLAAAEDKLFPQLFARRDKRRTPVAGLVLSSCLVSVIMMMNYTHGLVEQFTLVILLATLTTLFPYLLSSMALLMMHVLQPNKVAADGRVTLSSIIAVLAFLYSLWAMAGSGESTVYWGFLLLMAGIPVYVWMKWRQGVQS